MSSPILYCGDTELAGAASYLAGLMTACGWSFDYVPSDRPLSEETLGTGRKLFIISDYPAAQMPAPVQAALVEQVSAGAGLLTIGGWESCHGLGGDWDGTDVGNALPVRIGDVDDRVNFPQSAFLSVAAPDHPAIAGLPWSSTPPAIGGMNRVTTAPGGTVVLTARPLQMSAAGPQAWQASFGPELPALVVGEHGRGRTAAFLSDVAPHWVGGFVDWGDRRVTAQAAGAPGVEVGGWYADFWRQLLSWTARLA
jgi:hypothetical protein